MAERLTADISADLREYGKLLPARTELVYLLGEAADKLDGLIALLARAETDRDEARRELADIRARLAPVVTSLGGVGPQDGKTASVLANVVASLVMDFRAERDKAVAQIAEYEGAICWDTTCLSCGSMAESKARLQAALDRVRVLREAWRGMDPAASLDAGEVAIELDDALNGADHD